MESKNRKVIFLRIGGENGENHKNKTIKRIEKVGRKWKGNCAGEM
jgi:hypothetical protein